MSGGPGDPAADESGEGSDGDHDSGVGAPADRDRPRVALDASALMTPVEADVRVFEELDRLVGTADLVVPRAVIRELESLAGRGGEEGRAAAVGLDLADRGEVVETDASTGDDALVALAGAGRAEYVATNDRPLRDRVLARDVPVIGIRGRNKLAVTRP